VVCPQRCDCSAPPSNSWHFRRHRDNRDILNRLCSTSVACPSTSTANICGKILAERRNPICGSQIAYNIIIAVGPSDGRQSTDKNPASATILFKTLRGCSNPRVAAHDDGRAPRINVCRSAHPGWIQIRQRPSAHIRAISARSPRCAHRRCKRWPQGSRRAIVPGAAPNRKILFTTYGKSTATARKTAKQSQFGQSAARPGEYGNRGGRAAAWTISTQNPVLIDIHVREFGSC